MGEGGRRGNLACVDTYDITTDDLMLEDFNANGFS